MKKATTISLRRMKRKGEKIVMITAYDYLFSRLFSEAGVDIILVGDSLANVVQGRETTLPVTMDEMIYHTRMVVRGAQKAMVIGDMPFMSYQASPEDGLRNAGRFMKEACAQGVKLEGGMEIVPTVERLTGAGIPVMGHLGLTPQSVHQLGGYRVQGKKEAEVNKLMEDILALEAAGAFSVVLECVPAAISRKLSQSVKIPTIGIGAGVDCDGQVLVMHDILGLTLGHTATFVKKYADLAAQVREAVQTFIHEVRNGEYPGDEHSFTA
ncbi:MAG: 3-methyl-2-oxobutanoate hydroxymethyltransferase [Planctomycetota bacterium]|jgi:3-methyl-2-oxobutanoate hydroxymethyltransferase